MKTIVLMGFMGAGKTTIGKELAKAINCEFVDTDVYIEKEQEKKISDIFAEDGEEVFRDMETTLLKRLQDKDEIFVLSLGGGIPVRKENRTLLQNLGTIVYLKASKEEIIRRVSKDVNRPLLQGGDLERKIANLMDAREQIYKDIAHLEVSTDGKTPEQLVKEIQNIL